MYFFLISLLMLILPVISALTDGSRVAGAPLWLVFGKWFIFWGMGVRLFLAGFKQVTNPRYTAHKILGLKGDEALLVVRELGFANLAFGSLGVMSIFMSTWAPAAALGGGIFFLLAAINHAVQKHRNAKENFAMVSDGWAALVLAGYLVGVSI